MKKLIALSALFATAAGALHAGPFGLEFGTPVEELDIAEITIPERRFTFGSVPKPHPSFKEYNGSYAEGIGLCNVGAWSEIYELSRAKEVRDHALALKAALSKIYGEADYFTNTMFDDLSTPLKPAQGMWIADWLLDKNQTSETGIRSLHLSVEYFPMSEGPEISIFYISDKMDDCNDVWEAAERPPEVTSDGL